MYERFILQLKLEIKSLHKIIDSFNSSLRNEVTFLREQINTKDIFISFLLNQNSNSIKTGVELNTDFINNPIDNAAFINTDNKDNKNPFKHDQYNYNGYKGNNANDETFNKQTFNKQTHKSNVFNQNLHSQSKVQKDVYENIVINDGSHAASINNDTPSRNIDNNKFSSLKEHDSYHPQYVEIIGDSHLNAINENGLNSKDRNRRVKVRKWSGGSVEDMCDLVKSAIRRNPNEIIIHAGSNDMPKTSNIMRDIKKLTKIVKDEAPEIKLTFSSIMVRNDINGLNNKISDTNGKLRNYCDQNELGFIDNENINESFLGKFKLHMSKAGTSMLAKNILNHMNQG